jgi:hypothetical protein
MATTQSGHGYKKYGSQSHNLLRFQPFAAAAEKFV